jgi:hypothetical protein
MVFLVTPSERATEACVSPVRSRAQIRAIFASSNAPLPC